ncbi:hypothetical protein [Auraticoccus monumenti]|uniref:HeH/LEM domain-containing protein n=1 Tax=Auraticoccus monumenti TaxID=675864 RepID=A0A1G6UI23_9ACTN|nr:hypothetical protein [Auraticoccus monumenti]SDD40921.1 hypothetical protein SAMN04489747_0890 [Auraticoccus monumenti]
MHIDREVRVKDAALPHLTNGRLVPEHEARRNPRRYTPLEPLETPVDQLPELTKAQLRERVEQRGLDVPSSATKDELIGALTEGVNTDPTIDPSNG